MVQCGPVLCKAVVPALLALNLLALLYVPFNFISLTCFSGSSHKIGHDEFH